MGPWATSKPLRLCKLHDTDHDGEAGVDSVGKIGIGRFKSIKLGQEAGSRGYDACTCIYDRVGCILRNTWWIYLLIAVAVSRPTTCNDLWRPSEQDDSIKMLVSKIEPV